MAIPAWQKTKGFQDKKAFCKCHFPVILECLTSKVPEHEILAHSGTLVIAHFWNGSCLCTPEQWTIVYYTPIVPEVPAFRHSGTFFNWPFRNGEKRDISEQKTFCKLLFSAILECLEIKGSRTQDSGTF